MASPKEKKKKAKKAKSAKKSSKSQLSSSTASSPSVSVSRRHRPPNDSGEPEEGQISTEVTPRDATEGSATEQEGRRKGDSAASAASGGGSGVTEKEKKKKSRKERSSGNLVKRTTDGGSGVEAEQGSRRAKSLGPARAKAMLKEITRDSDVRTSHDDSAIKATGTLPASEPVASPSERKLTKRPSLVASDELGVKGKPGKEGKKSRSAKSATTSSAAKS